MKKSFIVAAGFLFVCCGVAQADDVTPPPPVPTAAPDYSFTPPPTAAEQDELYKSDEAKNAEAKDVGEYKPDDAQKSPDAASEKPADGTDMTHPRKGRHHRAAPLPPAMGAEMRDMISKNADANPDTSKMAPSLKPASNVGKDIQIIPDDLDRRE